MHELLELTIGAARSAGAILLQEAARGFEVRSKGTDDPVTPADLAADSCLRETLLNACPGYGWLSEETADTPERLACERVWIVDPMDGSREFVQRLPEYTVSVALAERGIPLIGVVHNPASGEVFAAIRKGGAFLNGHRVFCTEVTDLGDAVASVSRSQVRRGGIQPWQKLLREARHVGSMAYRLALVAAGRCDLSFSTRAKNEWDVCAGDLLVREAGAEMRDRAGRIRTYNQPDTLLRGGLVAANAALAHSALQFLRRHS